MAGKLVAVAVAAVTVVALAGCERSMRFGQQEAGQPKAFRIATSTSPTPILGATPVTIETWIKTQPAAGSLPDFPCAAAGQALVRSAGYSSYFGYYAPTVENRWVLGLDPDGDVFFAAQRESIPATDSDTAIPAAVCTPLPGVGVRDGAWHHIAAQRTLDGAVTIWIDGQRKGSGTSGAGSLDLRSTVPFGQFTDTISLGGHSIPSSTSTAPYVGALDEVRISNTLRYSGTFTRATAIFVADSETLALWHLDGLEGDTVPDTSGGGRHLTPVEAGSGGTGDGFAGESPFIP